MIAFASEQPETLATWQESFLAMLPEIQSRLRNEFRKLDMNSRAEAVSEGVAHCLFAYVRLQERGRAHFVTPFTLVRYSARHVRQGRPAAGRMNSKEPLSRYAQLKSGLRVDRQASAWIDELVEDKRASVPDQVAAKLDVNAWFRSLSRHMKHLARELALGSSTADVAMKFGVTAGRISQIRRRLEKSWSDFQAEPLTSLT